MNFRDMTKHITSRLNGYEVEESDRVEPVVADPIGDRPWGAPRTTIKSTHLHDLEPIVSFKREGLTIFYGARLGDLVAKHLTKEEVRDLTLALARRVTRELFDAANEMATVRDQYARDRAARLKK